MNLNPNCCGDHCFRSAGPVKTYPLGAGGNLILCAACWANENTYRRTRALQYGEGGATIWPTVDWASAAFYPENEDQKDGTS
jgi:hypothetical protein